MFVGTVVDERGVDGNDQGPQEAWAFLWGKRRWRRQPTSLSAQCGLKAHSITARAVNVSAGGVLLRIPAAEVEAVIPAGESASVFALYEFFARTFAVRLGAEDRDREVEGVRIDWHPDEPGTIYVGCRLAETLTEEDIEALGLEARIRFPEAGSSVRPADEMPWQARPDTSPRLRTRSSAREAWRDGTLRAMDGRSVAFTVKGAEPTGLVAELAHEPLHVRVCRGDLVVWDTTAWLLSVRLAEDGGLEVIVRTDAKPDEDVRGLFRRQKADNHV